MSSVKKASFTGILIALLLFVLQTCLLAQEAKFQQQEENGLVCMEAENFSEYIEPGEGHWDLVSEPVNYSGTGAMQALPAGFNDYKDLATGQMSAPILQYGVNFVKAELVYVWVRSSHVDGFDDSAWIGLEGTIVGTVPIGYTNAEQVYANEWYWINHWMGDDVNPASMDIPFTGVSLFEVYMREPSFRIDKIVLTTNVNYVPEGVGPAETLTGGVGVASGAFAAPDEFILAQNYPNPFNPTTRIDYLLPKNAYVTLTVYDALGHQVSTLVSQYQTAAQYSYEFDVHDLSSGIYFYKLHVDNQLVATKKMVIMK